MVTYLNFNTNSTVRVEEQATVSEGKIILRHIPKKDSIVIDGFVQTDNPILKPFQFSCRYATDSDYRDSDRVINFNQLRNDDELTVSYIAIGTAITADDMNEIKAHMENQELHGSGGSGGSGGYFKDNSTKMIYAGALDYRNIDDEYWAIDSRIGSGLDESFQSEAGRAPKVGDIVQYYAPGNDVGYTIRTSDKWVNLGYYNYPGGYYGDSNGVPNWDSINPLLSIKDRLKIAINPAFGFVPYSRKAGDIPLSPEGRKRFDDHKQYGEILVDLDHIEEREDAIDNDEDVNEDDYEGNYTLITRRMQNDDVDQIFSLGSEWGNICPLLTVKDRKLLDYLHERFDSQIPT